MGYELVDCEFAGRGLLRVFIDKAFIDEASDDASQETSAPMITVEDCERVSHQLTRVFTVSNVDYARLEISSPGLDRPLRKLNDYKRFVNHEISLGLRQAVEGSKHYRGILRMHVAENGEEKFAVEYEEKKALKSLEFTIDDVDKARLVPKIDFRSSKK